LAQWGDGPVRAIERRRLQSLSDAEFWKLCRTYLPPELQPLAAQWILRRTGAQEHPDKAGRPPVGEQVDALMRGPCAWDQRTARRLVAGPLCTCHDRNGLPAERCTCRAYKRVKAAHNQWRRRTRQ
jgi:hypothetical protein